jgi:hypothetical protein
MSHRSIFAVGLSISLFGCGVAAIESITCPAIAEEQVAIPSELPEPVANQLGHVAMINVIAPFTAVLGSGVQIGPTEYLTAGHVLLNEAGKKYTGELICGNVTVSQQSDQIGGVVLADNGQLKPTFGMTVDANRIAARYTLGDSSSTPDIGVITTATEVPDIDAPPTQVVYAASYAGEVLFSANYEPTANGVKRDPDQLYLGSGEANGSVLEDPTVYASVVLGYQSNGDVLVAEGLKSYGKMMDTTSREGASGGEVDNSSGDLVGLTIAKLKKRTVGFIDRNYPVNITSLPQNETLDITIVQPVTSQLVRTMEQQLVAIENNCRS